VQNEAAFAPVAAAQPASIGNVAAVSVALMPVLLALLMLSYLCSR
jgi:hypothetical protein